MAARRAGGKGGGACRGLVPGGVARGGAGGAGAAGRGRGGRSRGRAAGAWAAGGSRLATVGAVVALSGRVAPLGRYDAYQRRRGAHAALEVDRLRATGAWRGGLPGALDSVRRRAEAGLARGLSPPEAALLSGMVLGEDERLSEQVRTDFKRSGLAHLLAVSGQNVVLLAMLVLGAGMALGLPLRARLGAALMLVALYVPLAGGGPSIQRAGVMGAAGLVAALAGRPASRWYALGLAAAVTLAINPRASGEPGWQLSFAAVAGLLALVPRWREGLRRARLPGPAADAIAVTAAATLATAPLMALHFEQVSLASLPANLVAAPAVAPVMWLGMGSIALAQVTPALCGAAERAQRLAARLSRVDRARRRAAARGGAAGADRRPGRPGRRRTSPSPPRSGSPAARGAERARSATGSRCRRRSARAWWRRSSSPPRTTAPRRRAGANSSSRSSTSARATRRCCSATARPCWSTPGPPGGPILRRLAEAGVQRLDALLLTHAQADHEGMALAVIRARPPAARVRWRRRVADAGPASAARRRRAHRRRACGAGADARRRPLTAAVAAAAFAGLAARGRPQRSRRGRAGQRRLLRPAADGRCGVRCHGRPRPARRRRAEGGPPRQRGSGAAGLLARIRPEFAAIEVGRHNRYGHPAPSALAALRAAVPEVVRTDRDGTVRLRVERGGLGRGPERALWSPPPITTSAGSRLGRRARLQARLPRPRR